MSVNSKANYCSVVMTDKNAGITYSIEQLLDFEKVFPRPEDLIRIVLNGDSSGEIRPNRPKHTPRHSKTSRHKSQQQQQQQQQQHYQNKRQNRRDWSRTPALEQSENSFSVARKKQDQSESKKLIGEIRGLLNKVTTENLGAVQEGIISSGLIAYANGLEDEDQDEFLTEIAKLFVQKSQIDHEFSGLYAEMAHCITEQVVLFGDILYEVCRETIPKSRYDPERKRSYLGALLLLVEMRRVNLVSYGGISAFVDRLLGAIERCDPNTVFSVQSETDTPIDSVKQVEVCVELLCKFLPSFLKFEWPDWIIPYLDQLRALQQQKNRVKPRSRFMLMDFFKEISEFQKI